MSLVTALIAKNGHIQAGILPIFLEKRPTINLKVKF